LSTKAAALSGKMSLIKSTGSAQTLLYLPEDSIATVLEQNKEN